MAVELFYIFYLGGIQIQFSVNYFDCIGMSIYIE